MDESDTVKSVRLFLLLECCMKGCRLSPCSCAVRVTEIVRLMDEASAKKEIPYV
jgi:hypothetical protein